MSSLVAGIASRAPYRAMARFPLPWLIGWGARFQAGLRDEDASAATPAKIGEGRHAALRARDRGRNAAVGQGSPTLKKPLRFAYGPRCHLRYEKVC